MRSSESHGKQPNNDASLNNLTFQYYDTLIQLAELRRRKRTETRKEAAEEKLLKRKRVVVLGNSSPAVSVNSSSLLAAGDEKAASRPIGTLLPAFTFNETQLNKLPASIFRDKEHTINKHETHLLTPGKMPSVKVVKRQRTSGSSEQKSAEKLDLLKLKDVNSQRKPVNMRDLLNRKTAFDISPGKRDVVSELKPVSRTR